MEDQFYEGLPIGYQSLYPNGRIRKVNRKWLRILGYRRKDVLGRHFTEFMTSESEKTFRNRFPEFLEEGEVSFAELGLLHKGGSEVSALFDGTMVYGADGKPKHSNCLIRDITEMRRSVDALRRSEEKFRHIYESMTDAFATADMNGRIVEFNDAFVKMVGYAPEELRRLTYSGITPKKWHALDAEIKKQILVRGHSDIYLKEYIRKDGTVFPVELRAVLLRDKLGNPQGMLAIVRDITERKTAEEALKESEEKFRTIFNSANDEMFIIDLEGKFLEVNDILCRQLGYTRGELLKMRIAQIDSPEYAEKVAGRLAALENSGHAVFESAHMTREGREIPIEANAKLINYNGKKAIIAVDRDITERKKVEEALAESEGRYRGVVDNISIGVALISPKMEILTLNNQMRHWFPGVDTSKKSLCYRAFNTPPRDSICSYCPTCKTLEDGQVHEAVTETPAGGHVINFKVTASPVKDKQGNVIAAVEMVQDITARKKADEEIRRQGEDWERTFNSISDMISIHDRDYRIVRVNKAFVDAFGGDKEKLLGRPCYEVVHGSESPWPLCPVAEAIAGKKPITREFYEPKLSIYLEVTTSPIVIADGSVWGVIHLVKDISSRKKAEEEIKRHVDELEQFQKLTVDREEMMIELKNEVNTLLQRLGEEARYKGY